MAPGSIFTPKASLTEAPTNLKEAIDWVLRVTGRDGKALSGDECICGLAAAVTDLLQSVQLEYHGYEGDVKDGAEKDKGATPEKVKERLNGLFSLVQGLGGTAVVRTYIDQLAQVLSALVGWSKLDKCWGSGDKCTNVHSSDVNGNPHGGNECKYLNEVTPNDPCTECKCMKWEVDDPNSQGTPLGRGCTRCSDSGGTAKCTCGTSTGGDTCTGPDKCKCAKEGKCCKCCCKDCNGCKKECSCDNEKYKCHEEEKKKNGDYKIESYMSAYAKSLYQSYVGGSNSVIRQPKWNDLIYLPDSDTTSQRRHHCARILLGSVCLIWSGLTYMYWTGKWARGSPYWNNHILNGSGLDDGTLSQWLQALGFPQAMLNNSGPGNRLDAVIWNGFRDMFFLGFLEPSGLNNHHVNDTNGNTARAPFGMNYPGFVHTIHRDSFNTDQADVFKDNGTAQGINQHKNGAIFKLYILSCAYFTGLQKKTSESTAPKNPKTIREILYWLSALPYSKAYKYMLEYAKEVLKKKAPDVDGKKQLSFYQTGRWAPITVDEYNLFAHFQAVTQYCPLVLIGIQGGLKGTDKTTEPAIHALYANTECLFTYPTVSIQAYNQVVHYIRALFYQLYFLRKQCAVKVAMGGKWRECRYGKDVESKGVISWMCLGCDPMEHDRKKRVEKVKDGLVGVENELKRLYYGTSGTLSGSLKTLLEKIGDVVVQLGNAQEALEGKDKDAILGVKGKLGKAKEELDSAKQGLEGAVKVNGGLDGKLQDAKGKLGELTNGGGALDTLANGSHAGSLQQITSEAQKWRKEYSSAKDKISEVIHKVLEVLTTLKEGVKEKIKEEMNGHEKALNDAIDKLKDICNSPKCLPCKDHKDKCGQQGVKKMCDKCHQQYMDGFPSPLQAFLEDRLPGFSCNTTMELLEKWEASKAGSTPSSDEYPPAASHLGHCGGSGQCCPLPMGFRGQFQEGITNTGQRLYGLLYFFSNENMMQSCVYTLVRVTAALSATTPQVLGDVFGFFRGGVGNPLKGKNKNDGEATCDHIKDPSTKGADDYFCGWCASGLRDEVKKIDWVQSALGGKDYRKSVGDALINIKGEKDSDIAAYSSNGTSPSALSTLTKDSEYLSPLTGELYTAVSATFGGTYLSWVLYLSDALEGGLKSLSEAFRNIECRGCRDCDPNKCKKGSHGGTGSAQCNCSSIVSCTGVLPVLYRHGFSYGNPFNLEGYEQRDKDSGDYSIDDKGGKKQCHEFLDSLKKVIENAEKEKQDQHPLSNLLTQVGKLQYDIRLPWIFVLTLAWLVAVLYLAFGAIWPLDWTHMRSHWLRGGAHQWQCMWYKVMTGRKGMELVEYFGRPKV